MNLKEIVQKNKFQYEFNQEQILTFEKFTMLMQEEYLQALQCEQKFLSQNDKQIELELQQELQLSQQLQQEIHQAEERNKQLLTKYENILSNQINLAITQYERSIESNSQNIKAIEEKIQEKTYTQMIMKHKLMQKDQLIILNQSKLDSLRMRVDNLKNYIKKQYDDQIKAEKMIKNNDAQLQEMFNLKKKLNNQLQEIKGNIRVYCRIRPATSQKTVIKATSQNTLKLTLTKNSIQKQGQHYDQNFLFQHIFNENQTQSQVFDQIAQLVQNSIDGKNVCIFAYGQTGSGKTFTLLGPSQEQKMSLQQRRLLQGLTPRSIQLIFKEISTNNSFKWKYRIFLSIQEIYLDTIIDLIAKSPTSMDNIKQVQVTSIIQVELYLREAIYARKTAQTHVNQRSSRSHLIVTLRIQGQSLASPNQMRNGSLTFIDLAGSERLKQSKVQGEIMKQSMAINKSLSALGNVINGIRKCSQHIPFRNSKLTHSLQKYLQGDSKTLMFVNISPDQSDSFQTKISLSFAEGVRECKLNKK